MTLGRKRECGDSSTFFICFLSSLFPCLPLSFSLSFSLSLSLSLS